VIVSLNKTTAQDILSFHTLSPRTQQIADYWLSLWDGDTLPARADIRPAAIKALLPQMIFFWVTPHQAVRVGLAGTAFRFMCKKEISHCDWLALTPQEGRIVRLSIFSLVAHGTIGFNVWRFPQITGKTYNCEKLLLPLRAESGTDIPVLGFVDWSTLREGPWSNVDLAAIPPPALFDAAPAIQEGGLTC
jgi:hypothetical protein